MKRSVRENLAGILITVSVHLAVILVLLLTVVNPRIQKEASKFEFDFSKQEQREKIERELEKQKAINEKLEKMLRENGVGDEPVRNVTVNRGKLKDDRGTDAEKLYKDAARIQKEYEKIMSRKDDGEVATYEKKPEKKPKEPDQTYSGPSVLSYDLPGRKGSSLPIPAYKCMGEGEVTVNITVDPSGKVIGATVKDDVSSDDSCLRSFAISAAKRSRFSRKPDAAPKEFGYITYKFIAQ